jgi:hypothetical protein
MVLLSKDEADSKRSSTKLLLGTSFLLYIKTSSQFKFDTYQLELKPMLLASP